MCQVFGRKENQSGESQMVFWAPFTFDLHGEKRDERRVNAGILLLKGDGRNEKKPLLFNPNNRNETQAGIFWHLISNAGTCTTGAPYEWEEKYQSTAAKISNALKIFLPHTWSQLEGVSAKKQRWIFFTQKALEIMNKYNTRRLITEHTLNSFPSILFVWILNFSNRVVLLMWVALCVVTSLSWNSFLII